MNQSNSSKQVLLSVIGVAILVVAVVGVSFAFFNYTRTGGVNQVRTGNIFFEMENGTTDMYNLFPVSASTVGNTKEAIADKVFVSTVRIHGYTTYANGIDYVVTAEDVTINSLTGDTTKKLPISVDTYVDTGLGTVTETGAPDSIATTVKTDTVYTYDFIATVSNGKYVPTIDDGSVLARGHIQPGQVASDGTITPHDVDGNIYVRAYVDANHIIITDTDSNVTATSPYLNGTDTTGKTVFTTNEWNSLNSTGASFKVKVEAYQAADRTNS